MIQNDVDLCRTGETSCRMLKVEFALVYGYYRSRWVHDSDEQIDMLLGGVIGNIVHSSAPRLGPQRVSQRNPLPYSQRVCFHEAGHAVVARKLRRRPTEVRVTRHRTGYTAGVLPDYPIYNPATVRSLAVILLAGVHAEALVSRYTVPELLRDSGLSDIEYAREAIRWLVRAGHEPDMRTAWRRTHRETRETVRAVWPAVTQLAEQLRVRGRVGHGDVAKSLKCLHKPRRRG